MVNREYELSYWKDHGVPDGVEAMRKKCAGRLKVFNKLHKIPPQRRCMEIGAGPFGGMALVYSPATWTFVDPLEDEYAKMAEAVLDRVIEEQKITVDATTGATTTSLAFLKAVELALTTG